MDKGAAFTGGAGDDTYDASTVNSLSNGDVLNGGLGTDTLTAVLNAHTAIVDSTSVEQFNLTATGAATLNMAAASGVTGIANVGSANTLTLNNLASVPTVDINTNSSVTTLNFSNAAMAGTNTLTINLDGLTNAANADTGDVILTSAAGATNVLETVSIVSRSVANSIETLSTTGVGATALNISGDQNLTIADALNNEIVTVSAGAATGALSFSVGANGVAVTTGSGADSVVGGAGNDNISAGAGNDTLLGNGGADTISGADGDDQITGGAGVDILTGGNGADTFFFTSSAELIPTAGNDAVIDSVDGGSGIDVVSVAGTISIGAAGTDSLARITGVETLTQTSGAGSTVVLASDAALSGFRTIDLSAASAANTVTLTGVTVGVAVTGSSAAATADVITGGAGNDTLTGGTGNNTVSGAAGDDTITLGTGSESISGGADNDTIVAGGRISAADTIDGGAGTDTLTAGELNGSWADGVTNVEVINFSSLNGAADDLTIANTLVAAGETVRFNLTSGGTTDTFSIDGALEADGHLDIRVTAGSAVANTTLTGGGISDTIIGGSGSDTITGGAGNDSVDGGEGSDTYVYADSQFVAGDVIADTGNAGTDTVAITSTTAITDAMFANKTGLEAATLSSAVSYTLGANAQAAGITSVTFGAAGTLVASDYTVGLNVTDATGNQTITTGSGNDTVTLAAGNDNVTLGAGNDTVVGGANVTAADTLTGGAGTDVLTLNGGATAGSAVTTSITFDGDFTTFEQITVSAGLTATAVADQNDTAGSVNDYTLALVDANVAAGSTFTVDASALRTGITTSVGANNEIGGGDDTTTGEENLSLDASNLTGTRFVSVVGGAGADTVLGGAAADTITGNAGADSLVGNGGADVISGGDGDDTITGGDGADNLAGGAGNDTFVQTYAQFNADADSISGGTGTNTLEITTATDVTVAEVAFNGRLSDITNVKLTGDSADVFTWTMGAYSHTAGVTTVTVGTQAIGAIDATSYASGVTLTGGTGADTLTGSAFADSITGGTGSDIITAGDGNDIIAGGGTDANNIDAGAGNDFITLASANDTVVAGTGNDTVVGGSYVTADDTLTGGAGTDVLTLTGAASAGSNATTTISFDADFTTFEQITLNAGVASVDNATGNDTAGGANLYVLTLGDASNVAAGVTMTVDASALRSGVITALGADNVIGGANADTTTDETLNLSATSIAGSVSVLGGAGNDTVSGSAQADTITGNGGADSLVGNGGADVISGGDGADTVTGGAAADIITLGDGADVVIIDSVANSTGTTFDTITDFVSGTDKINITLTTSNSNFDVSGFAVVSNFNDGLVSLSTARGDSFYSTADGKLYVDDNGSGTINASLDHVVSLNIVSAADINFSITGGTSANTIVGGAGADTITADAGADVITGGAGADTIDVGSEAAVTDVVVVAAGDTVLTIGGSGNVGTISGYDVVSNFAAGDGTHNSDALNVQGTGAIATATAGTNGTDSTLTINGATIKSHAIAGTGLITFDDADSFGSALTISTAADLAAVVQYLQANDIGSAGMSVIIDFGADDYIYTQGSDSGSDNTLDTLVKLVGVQADTFITTNGSGANDLYIL